MDGWKDGRTDRRTDGRTDGWMDRWMDGWMDGWIYKDLQYLFFTKAVQDLLQYSRCTIIKMSYTN